MENIKDIDSIFNGKNILITGATGTIGRELVMHLVKYKPNVIRVFSRDEAKQLRMQQEMRLCLHSDNSIENVRDNVIRYLIGDIRDEKRLRQALKEIDIVFHTAAMKHVLACEYNPFEALKTNVLGTQNLIDASIEAGVEMFVYTSSDKAVNPSNAMGASKLFAEKLVTAANYYKGHSKTCFFTVRFGNVLGSNGSFTLNIFEQISRDREVTLTDPRMTRFVMSIQDATQLILKAATLARGGEIFILKMPAVKIKDLIETMIEEIAPRFGLIPADIKIKEIGAFPGEKLYEELLTEEEGMRAIERDELFIIPAQIQELVRKDATPDYGVLSIEKQMPGRYDSKQQPHLDKTAIQALLRDSGLIRLAEGSAKKNAKDSGCYRT